jgi:coenzyme F420-0:L-glutamate ligase
MLLIPIKTALVAEGDDLVGVMLESIQRSSEALRDGDIIAVADKILSICQGRVRRLEEVKPSERAETLAQRFNLEASFMELILQESDEIFHGVPRAILTLKDGIMTVNGGVDRKNAPEGYAILWPRDPNGEAAKIMARIREETGKKVGVIIIDSSINPLRRGTTGIALGMAGFKAVEDVRRRRDLYGKEIFITLIGIADNLAASAHLLMGEADEQIPLVIIRDHPLELVDEYNPDEVKLSREECLYLSTIDYLMREASLGRGMR